MRVLMRSVALRLSRSHAAPARCYALRRPYPGYSCESSSAVRSRQGDRSRGLCSGAGGEKLKVVLDMDECMIHSVFLEGEGGTLRQFEERPEVREKLDELTHFKLEMQDGETCLVLQRPNLADFLDKYKERFDFGVFTAGVEMYASPLLDKLDPDGSIFTLGRWYREQCTLFGSMYCKDLSKCHPDPNRVLLVDNNPASFVLAPSSGLLVPSWYEDAADTLFDSSLGSLGGVLEQLEAAEDVREVLAEMQPELQINLADVREKIKQEEAETM